MKKLIYLFLAVLIVPVMMTSCEDERGNLELLESPPSIEITIPNLVEEGSDLEIGLVFSDGLNEELSISPLASASYSIVDTLTLAEVASGTFTLSGLKDEKSIIIEGGLPIGAYKLTVTATDTGGNSSEESEDFDSLEPIEIGIIGAGIGGWGDADELMMVRNEENPNEFTRDDVVVFDGEVKFRANRGWAVNWGAEDFPSGTGTQDGPNIPTEAGTYNVTFNVDSGEYSFSPVE